MSRGKTWEQFGDSLQASTLCIHSIVQQQILEPECVKHRAGPEDVLEKRNNPFLMVLPQSGA